MRTAGSTSATALQEIDSDIATAAPLPEQKNWQIARVAKHLDLSTTSKTLQNQQGCDLPHVVCTMTYYFCT